MIFQTEKALTDLEGKIDDAEKSSVEGALNQLKDAVKDLEPATMTESDVSNVKSATETLKQEFYKISEKLYQAAGAANAEGAAPQDDVVDGEGKEL